MPKCSYRDCSSTSKSKKGKTLKYYPFPKPKTNRARCLLWLELCGNENVNLTNISKNTYICEKHFAGVKNIKSNPIPHYEAMGEDPRIFRSVELGQIIEVGSSSRDDYMEVVSCSEQERQSESGDHNYSKIPVAVASTADTGTQTCSRNIFSVNEVRADTHETNQNRFFFRNLCKSDDFQYFTGLTVQQFHALFEFLDPSVMPQLKYTRKNTTPVKSNKLKRFTDKDKLCLTLVRLKRGYTLKELAVIYDSSLCHVSVIFYTWLQFIYLQCCSLRNTLFRGSRNMDRSDMPACFRKFEEKVTVILDGTEVKMQMSKNFQRQGNTHSSYKHYNSVKFLVGVSPRGAIIYNSEGYEGSISDNELFKSCDIHHFLEEGDVLMVDRGFTIQDVCDENNLKLLIPPFLAGTGAG